MTLPSYPLPNARGRYGRFGGRYVPETLIPGLEELRTAYEDAKRDSVFLDEFHGILREYVGRPSRLYFAKNLTERLGGAKIYLKREDLNHTGAHKINNTIGQVCSLSAWARSESLPRPERVSTAWRPPPPAL